MPHRRRDPQPARRPGRGAWAAAQSVAGIGGWLAGLLTFSGYRYHWASHSLIADVGWARGIAPMLLLSALLAGALWRARASAPRRAALAKVVATGALGWPLAALQLATATELPVFMYAWVALAAFCAWRIAARLPALKWPRALLALVLLAGLASVVGLQIQMQYEAWRGFSLGFDDIGAFARALQHAAAGRGLWIDPLRRTFLAEHAAFAMYALVPLCMVGLKGFDVLVWTTPICLCAPAILLALHARWRTRSDGVALLAGLAWLLHPGIWTLVICNSYGFHEAFLAVVPLAAGLALTLRGRCLAATPFMFAALLAREDLALTLTAWAIYVAIVQRQYLLGSLLAAFFPVYLLVAVKLIVPAFRGAPYPHFGYHFAHVARGLVSPATWGYNASFLVSILLPMAFLPLRRPALALVAVPVLIETMLTGNRELHNIGFWYYTPALVVFAFAAVDALAGPPRDAAPPRRRARRNSVALFAAAFLSQLYFGLGPLSHNAFEVADPELLSVGRAVDSPRARFPRSTRVTASFRIASHFLDYERIWPVSCGELGDLVVVDDRDHWDGSHPRETIAAAVRAGGYQPVIADDDIVALVRLPEPTPLTRQLRPAEIPPESRIPPLDFRCGIELAGSAGTLGESRGGFVPLRLTLYWRCTGPVRGDLRFGLATADGALRFGPYWPAGGAYPTATWRGGDLYRDELTLDVPEALTARIPQMQPVWFADRSATTQPAP
ncbi:MAG: DUF2079 domain-containing protein [Phycisphaerae bacterium]